jgi:hypothetical protein
MEKRQGDPLNTSVLPQGSAPETVIRQILDAEAPQVLEPKVVYHRPACVGICFFAATG